MIKVLWSKHDKKWIVYQTDEAFWFSASEVDLENCLFYVNEQQRQNIECLAKQHGEFMARYPHAAVLGDLIKSKPAGEWRPFSYNPFKGDFFYLLDDGSRLESGQYVHLCPNGHGEVILRAKVN